MLLRQKIQFSLMIFLTLLAFGAYHEGTGSVVWLQWLSVLSIMAFLLIFDLGFTDESNFIFDPDAENWRRKVVSSVNRTSKRWLLDFFLFTFVFGRKPNGTISLCSIASNKMFFPSSNMLSQEAM